MGSNYFFHFQPTFTQGLLLGQLSVLILLILILKYLFLDSTQSPFETSSYQPRAENDFTLRNRRHEPQNVSAEDHDRPLESTEWLNALLQQVILTSTSCSIVHLKMFRLLMSTAPNCGMICQVPQAMKLHGSVSRNMQIGYDPPAILYASYFVFGVLYRLVYLSGLYNHSICRPRCLSAVLVQCLS